VNTEEEIRSLLVRSEELWNAGDRDGFLALWKHAVPGDYTLETPVGAEPRRGWDACRRAVWDEFQATTRLHTKRIIVCGHEAAALVENEVSIPSSTFTNLSIDTYNFGPNGSCIERNYFETTTAS